MRKLFLLSLSMLLTVSLCSCGGSDDPLVSVESETSVVSFDLSAYQADVSAYKEATYQASIILANVGNYENNFWKALGRLSENMADSAFEWLSENSEETRDTVVASNDSISEAYNNLISTNFGEDPDASEIDVAVRMLYDRYSELYSLVTEPSGTRDAFVLSLSSLIEDIEAANDALTDLLSEGK